MWNIELSLLTITYPRHSDDMQNDKTVSVPQKMSKKTPAPMEPGF